MPAAYLTPGVYREEIFLKPEARLPTGVPGFVGFADPADGILPKAPVSLHRKEEFFARFEARAGSYLADAVSAFFENGGVRCYVALADPAQERETALKSAIDMLAPLTDLDLVAVPDAMSLQLPGGLPEKDAVLRVQGHVLQHCATHGDRLAILDALPTSVVAAVLVQRRAITLGQAEPVNGALYYPWLKTADGRLVPPCGHVAGVIARSDAKVGVYKAPANEEVLGVLDLGIKDDTGADRDLAVTDELQAQLNPEGVNCLRAFPGRGIRVWGARTLSLEPDWRYISVRRLFLTLSRWTDRNMGWAAFEPNGPRLWVRIQRELGAYLIGLWRAGAVVGDTPEQAFYVKCDVETNPPETRETGQVVTEIGLAPGAPAEFVVVRIVHRAGGTA